MKSSVKNIKMTSYDDLFNPAQTDTGEKIVTIPLAELHAPRQHPFKVIDDDAMREMAESITKYGVMVPGIARPLESGGYELVAGVSAPLNLPVWRPCRLLSGNWTTTRPSF